MTQRHRRTCEDRRQDWSYVATSQDTRRHQKLGGDRQGTDCHSEPTEVINPSDTLLWNFSTLKTVREYTAVSDHQICGDLLLQSRRHTDMLIFKSTGQEFTNLEAPFVILLLCVTH